MNDPQNIKLAMFAVSSGYLVYAVIAVYLTVIHAPVSGTLRTIRVAMAMVALVMVSNIMYEASEVSTLSFAISHAIFVILLCFSAVYAYSKNL